MRVLRLLPWAAAVALGILAEGASGGFGAPAKGVADLLTGWALLAGGLIAWTRTPRAGGGLLLTAVGAMWFAGNFFAGALFWYRGPLVHLLLAFPGTRPGSRLVTVAIGGGYAAAVVPAVWASESAAIVLAATLLCVAYGRRRLAVGPARRAQADSLAATAAVSSVLVAGAAARLMFPQGDADDAALLALEVVLVAVGVLLAVSLATRSWERPALTDLIVELGERRSPTARDALARAVGDPSLEVGYWMPDAAAYVDLDGRQLRLPEEPAGGGRAVTLVDRDGCRLAALVHDGSLLDDPPLLVAVTGFARMAGSNARLQAEARAQLAELEASRRRIVAAAAEQRRALARRLDDGAGRLLRELAADLGTVPGVGRVEHAQALLSRARDDLEALGRGLHPRAISDHGLAEAVRSLAASGPLRVTVSIEPERLPLDLEGVAYFVCAEALSNAAKHGGAKHAAVTVGRRDGHVTLTVEDDGAGGAVLRPGGGLVGLVDRVETAGGTLRLESAPGSGTRIHVALPLTIA